MQTSSTTRGRRREDGSSTRCCPSVTGTLPRGQHASNRAARSASQRRELRRAAGPLTMATSWERQDADRVSVHWSLAGRVPTGSLRAGTDLRRPAGWQVEAIGLRRFEGWPMTGQSLAGRVRSGSPRVVLRWLAR